RFRVKGLSPADSPEKNLVRVWMPCSTTTDCQQVARLPETAPEKLQETKEQRYGNALLYFETRIRESGVFAVDVPYVITLQEVGHKNMPSKEQLDDAQRALLLSENDLVPNTGKPLLMLRALELQKDQIKLARQLYEVVDDHVTYKKEGTGWGRGDTNWV